MGKKKLVITLLIAEIILLLGLAVLFFSGNQITVARCIVTDNGSVYMVYDDRPVHLSYEEDANCQTGDKLLIVHASAFAESYPEQVRTLLIIKVGSGSEEDIPQKAFDVLIETGNWNQ